MGTDCKSAAFQLRWFESTRAHKKTASVEIRWRFSVCRKLEFPCGWIRTAAALSRKTAQKQPGGLFLAARLAQSTRAHQELQYPNRVLEFLFYLNFYKAPQGWIRTAAALSQKTAQKQPGELFLAARLAQSTRAHKKTVSVEIRWRFSVCRGWRGCSRGQAGCPLTGLAGFYRVTVLKSRRNFNFHCFLMS